MRQFTSISRTFGCCQKPLVELSTLSDATASFTVTMLASVSSGSNLGQKEVLFFLAMGKTYSSSALE